MRPKSTPRSCSASDCSKTATSRGMCSAHYVAALQAAETRPCKIEGCVRPLRTMGYCNTHYVQSQRKGDPLYRAADHPKPAQLCSVDGCDTAALARGLCSMHYQRMTDSGTTATPLRSQGEEARFWHYAGAGDRGSANCWLWTGGKLRNGYGKFKADGRTVGAHHWAYSHFREPVPDGLVVRHRCPNGPNRLCVNPAHMLIGTPADNVRDRDEDGTTLRGEHHPNAKLTADDIRVIRSAYASGLTFTDIARNFSTSLQNVRAIVLRHAWKHVA